MLAFDGQVRGLGGDVDAAAAAILDHLNDQCISQTISLLGRELKSTLLDKLKNTARAGLPAITTAYGHHTRAHSNHCHVLAVFCLPI